jgi:hypothetical protein
LEGRSLVHGPTLQNCFLVMNGFACVGIRLQETAREIGGGGVSQKYLYVAAYLSIGHRQQAIVQLLKALPVFLQLLKHFPIADGIAVQVAFQTRHKYSPGKVVLEGHGKFTGALESFSGFKNP